VPKDLVQTIVDAWKTEAGRSASVSYNKDQGLVDLILYDKDFAGNTLVDISARSCSYVETKTYYWGIADPSTYTIPDSTADGYSYTKAVYEASDGGYDVVITTRQSIYRNYAERMFYKSAMSQMKERVQLAVTDQAVPDVTVAATAGTTRRQDIKYNTDCSKDVTTTIDEAQPNSEYISWTTRYGTAKLKVWRNWSAMPSLPDSDLSALDNTTSNSIDVSINEDGSLNVIIRKMPFSATGDVAYFQDREDLITYEIEKRSYKTGTGESLKLYQWRVMKITSDIKYHTESKDAWDEIHGGLKGSSVARVHGLQWRSIKIKKIELKTDWADDPVDIDITDATYTP
jgi:hypothetical protein